MTAEFSRSARVASQIQREIAELIRTDIRDPAIGMVTVSGVDMTRDLSYAKIFVSFLGGDANPKAAIKRLSEYLPQLRHELSRRVRLRVLPELSFHYDDSIERGFKMDGLLAGLSRAAPEDDSDADEN